MFDVAPCHFLWLGDESWHRGVFTGTQGDMKWNECCMLAEEDVKLINVFGIFGMNFVEERSFAGISGWARGPGGFRRVGFSIHWKWLTEFKQWPAYHIVVNMKTWILKITISSTNRFNYVHFPYPCLVSIFFYIIWTRGKINTCFFFSVFWRAHSRLPRHWSWRLWRSLSWTLGGRTFLGRCDDYSGLNGWKIKKNINWNLEVSLVVNFKNSDWNLKSSIEINKDWFLKSS